MSDKLGVQFSNSEHLIELDIDKYYPIQIPVEVEANSEVKFGEGLSLQFTNYIVEFFQYFWEELKERWKALMFLNSEIAASKYKIEQDSFADIRPLRCDVNTAIDYGFKMLYTEAQFDELLGKLGIDKDYVDIYRIANLKIPTETELTEALIRGLIDVNDYKRELRRLGYDENYWQLFLGIRLQLPNETDIFLNWLRGYITEDEANDWLQRLGLSEEAIEFKKRVIWYYPSASDWIRFAVRDVFNETYVKLAGLDEGYPHWIEAEAMKSGLKPEHLKLYWRAHWQPVSPTQIYEMLHRRIITKEEAKTLLKIADYPPYMVDKLMAISYMPYTRVDIRRMYALGVVNELEVYETYLDLGYDKEKAKNLTKFTILSTQPEKKSLSLSKIEKGYKRQWFTQEETIKLLKNIGYSEFMAKVLIAYWDYEVEEEKTEAKINAIKHQFMIGLIDDIEMHKRLVEMNLPASEVDYLYEMFIYEKQAKAISLSVQDILDAFYYGLINEQEAIKKLINKGYTEQDAKLKLELNTKRKTRGVIRR